MNATNGHLPKGWRHARLGEICEAKTGSTDPALNPDALFTYIDISSVDNSLKRVVSPRQLLGKDAPSRARQLVRTGDVIVSTTRPNLNAVALIPPALNGQICSTGFCVLRPKNDLDMEFLFAFVQSAKFVTALSDLVKGALYPAVTDAQVRALEVPLPPLSEQRRIADVLLKRLADVTRARAATADQLAAANTLPAAFLRAIFQSSQAKTWPRIKFGDIAKITSLQVDPCDCNFRDLPHISGENIESGTLSLHDVLSATEDGMTSGKYIFDEGDVLYSKLRPYLRKVAIAPFRGLCSADMYPLKVDPSRTFGQFIAWLLLSDEFSEYAIGQSQRSRMPKLNREQLFNWYAPYPDLLTQRRIATDIQKNFAVAAQLRRPLEAQAEALARLPTALFNEAFTGRL